MGTLRSNELLIGYEYKGIILGDPAELDGDPTTYEYDHERFPNGTVEIIDGELTVIIDSEEL